MKLAASNLTFNLGIRHGAFGIAPSIMIQSIYFSHVCIKYMQICVISETEGYLRLCANSACAGAITVQGMQ